MMDIASNKVVREVLSLLYWSMLAACTVGPGTVVTCARAGAEFQLSLIYVLVFASAMAFILQVTETKLKYLFSNTNAETRVISSEFVTSCCLTM